MLREKQVEVKKEKEREDARPAAVFRVQPEPDPARGSGGLVPQQSQVSWSPGAKSCPAGWAQWFQ